jgi:triosephosphate isomerase
MRHSLIAGNWKMNASLAGNEAWIEGFELASQKLGVSFEDGPQIMLCVPAPYWFQMSELIRRSSLPIILGAQNVSEHDKGAFTGEVSVPMMQEMNLHSVILGHSERRQWYGESDEAISKKVVQVLAANLTPIVCVGESLSERESAKTFEVIQRQVAALLSKIQSHDLERLVVAYEPIWAIGTGLTATPEQAQEVHAFIRQELLKVGPTGSKTRILYGGSMNPSNAKALLSMTDIDGGLIGGASLVPEDFLKIISSAKV